MTGAPLSQVHASPASRAGWVDTLLPSARHSGISVVREKIKMFAQKKVTLPPGKHKIIVLDEADRCAPTVQ